MWYTSAMIEIDWRQCPDVESVPDRCHGAPVVKGTRVMVQGILDNAGAGCSAEQIALHIFPSVTVDQVRRVLRFARLAEAADLLSRAENIVHDLWDEADRDERAREAADLLLQTANEIVQAAGTLAQVA
jgi:uncharacterized protein (DUF433 family)